MIFSEVIQSGTGCLVFFLKSGTEPDCIFRCHFEVAPGRFHCSLTVPADEAVQLVEQSSFNTGYLIAGSPLSAETQVDPADGLDLARLAQVTDGAILSQGQSASAVVQSADSLSIHKLWPWVLLFALLVYLAELAYRRWPQKNRH